MEQKKEEENQGFEFYLSEIERVLAEMEQGGIGQLDSLLKNYEYGSQLIEKCNKILKEAEIRVEKITNSILKEKSDENS